MWQAVVHALLQHTPWAQNPLWHSFGKFEQLAPFGLGPHWASAPCPPQTVGGMHWLSFEHDEKHLVALQWYGLQGIVAGFTHWPELLQVDSPV